jgi:hypothetical protein
MKRNLPIILTAWTASFRTFTVMVQDNTIPKSDRPVYARDPLAVEMQVNMRRLTQWVSLEFFGPAPVSTEAFPTRKSRCSPRCWG